MLSGLNLDNWCNVFSYCGGLIPKTIALKFNGKLPFDVRRCRIKKLVVITTL